jgi:HSP20 family protein
MNDRHHTDRERERQTEQMNRRMEERQREMERQMEERQREMDREQERLMEEMRRHADLTRRSVHPGPLPEEVVSTGGPEADFQARQPDLHPAVSPGPEYGMQINLVERDEEFVLTAAVPGFSPDEIDVRLVDDVLQIEATKEESEEREEEGQYVMHERRRSMSRSVALGAPIAEDEEISAHYENGLVIIRLPKAEPTEDESVRQINIE